MSRLIAKACWPPITNQRRTIRGEPYQDGTILSGYSDAAAETGISLEVARLLMCKGPEEWDVSEFIVAVGDIVPTLVIVETEESVVCGRCAGAA
jgi:hypothetical protein